MTTIKDVAAKAGVSIASASRVLSDSRSVNPETRRVVEEAAEELGYVPNEMARGLKLARSNLMACVIPDITNPFFPELVRGFEDIASEGGYGTLLCNTDNDVNKEASYLQLLAQRRIDGLLLIPSGDEDPPPGLLQILAQDAPVVVMDRHLNGFTGDSIFVDNRLGASLAAEHVVELGHERVGIINRALDTSTARHRQEGYEGVLRSTGVFDESLTRYGRYSFDSGLEMAEELLDTPRPPTAILAGSDVLAIATLHVADELGLSIPGDVSIVGFDRIAMSQLVRPTLTTVAQPIYEMARLAADLLLQRARGERTGLGEVQVLEPELHIGHTTRRIS